MEREPTDATSEREESRREEGGPAVLYRVEPPAAFATLNRPDRRNAIDADLIEALHSALDRALDDEDVRAVVITGSGSAFCAGIDLKSALEQADSSFEDQLAAGESLARMFRRLSTFEKVTIAAVNGPALASGCGLALVCDFTLATGVAKFGFPEVRMGFVPAIVSVYLRGMISEKRMRDLLLTGRTFSADEAKEMGLVSEVVPADDLLDRSLQLARTIAANAPLSIQMTKELLEALPGLEIDRALKLAVEHNARIRGTEENVEGIRAFLERRSPRWALEAEANRPDAPPPAEPQGDRA